MRGIWKGTWRQTQRVTYLEGDFKQDKKGTLNRMELVVKLRSRSGLVLVWFSLQIKYKSLEL